MRFDNTSEIPFSSGLKSKKKKSLRFYINMGMKSMQSNCRSNLLKCKESTYFNNDTVSIINKNVYPEKN